MREGILREGGREGGKEGLLTWGVHHHHPLFRRGGQVNIVHTHAGSANDHELVSGGDDIASHLRKREGGK